MRYGAALVDDFVDDAGRVEQNPGLGPERQRRHFSIRSERGQVWQ